MVSEIIVLPVSFIFLSDNVPPMQNTITERVTDNKLSVSTTKSLANRPNISGLSTIPAKMYPDILGSLILSAISPKMYPTRINNPMLSMFSMYRYLLSNL